MVKKYTAIGLAIAAMVLAIVSYYNGEVDFNTVRDILEKESEVIDLNMTE
jgi:hypothetical protein